MTDEKIMQEMEEGTKDENIYSEEGQEKLIEDDEIDLIEEGFMKGYEEGEHLAKCAECKKVLVDEDFIEEELEGRSFRFCSEKCATKFEVKEAH